MKTPPSERLFVALELPGEARRSISAWSVRALPDELRLVKEEQLHVTLAFLGWQPAGSAGRVAELVRAAVAGCSAVPLVPAGLRGIPESRPRLLALDLEDPDGACEALQGAVEQALAAAGVFEPESHPFWVHVTLARVRRGRGAPPLPEPPPAPPETFVASQAVLFRSTLRPEGAAYEPLERFELGS